MKVDTAWLYLLTKHILPSMYAVNTFLRIVRFVSNTFLGLVVGFVIGVLYSGSSDIDFSQWLHLR